MTPINAEWLNQNSLRAYPFKENFRRRPFLDNRLLDDYALPNCAIVDLVITTGAVSAPAVYLSSFVLSGTKVSATLANAETGEVLAVVSTDGADADYTPVNFTGAGRHDDIRGTLVFGDIEHLSASYPDGVYTFLPEETPFEARCVRPSLPCVSGLHVMDVTNGEQTLSLRGDVALVAGTNIRLDFDPKNNAVVINAVDNSAFSELCDCGGNFTPIRTINGINARNVVIEGDGECVNVSTSGGKIVIEDTCSAPTCGCSELTFLNLKIGEVRSSLRKLESYTGTLEQRMSDLRWAITLLGNK